MIAFSVVGEPQTQGSKSAVQRGGRAWVIEGGNSEKRRKHVDWRTAVADAARDANPGELLAGPVTVLLTFGMTRPASAPKRRRTWPINARSGDADKLARSVLDSLTGTILRDDAQVVRLLVIKDWADPPGVQVTIEELAGEQVAS